MKKLEDFQKMKKLEIIEHIMEYQETITKELIHIKNTIKKLETSNKDLQIKMESVSFFTSTLKNFLDSPTYKKLATSNSNN